MKYENVFGSAVKSADESTPDNSPKVLGVYEGECADANVTNLNGLDITRQVWENVFESEEYKNAIDKGWYIGYLGHPEDPNCMDFQQACIVMTEGHIDDDGKIYGKFNLVDTPVGRIVKSFQDAGVTFGISVRGAGDIIDNSVDPDTFVFRGFDLVSFPAYPDSVPTFTEVAASTDVEKQRKYKAVCAAVKDNIDGLNTPESIKIVKACFAKQSDEYKELEKRENEIVASETVDIEDQRVIGLTDLYLSEKLKSEKLEQENKILAAQIKQMESQDKRVIKSMRRIMSSQLAEMDQCVATISRKKAKVEKVLSSTKSELKSIKEDNLKYKHKVEASQRDIRKKDRIISDLRFELDKTVVQASENLDRASNLDETNAKLREDIKAATKLVEEYQDAYAILYSSAVGSQLNDVSIKASTSVDELKSIINRSSSIHPSATITEPTLIDVVDCGEESDLVTL